MGKEEMERSDSSAEIATFMSGIKSVMPDVKEMVTAQARSAQETALRQIDSHQTVQLAKVEADARVTKATIEKQHRERMAIIVISA